MTGPTAARRNDYYRRLDPHAMAPLWEVLGDLVTPSPASRCRPACWRYAEIRSLLLESGDLISAREAERRVLVLENPGLRGESRITTSLYAGLQLILPGEIAPAHRHTQAALRFVVEGEGAYTAVDGEKAVMREGDFIITPSGTWHDHGNESDRPVVWLDGLDIPIVSLFDASFAERHPDEAQAHSRPSGETVARYGSGLLPLESPSGRASPIFSFPYAKTRDALDRLGKNGTADACHGIRMKYANPVDGGYALPTIATFIQLFPRGFAGALHRSTDATVFCVAEGEGRTVAGEETFAWGPRDTFVVPSWCPRRHEVEEEAVLFSFSDRAVQESLGLWREEREPFGGTWT
ncbi:MAG: gentisate 1,2-dioxygenase [Immundisolibacterales bacterium]|nr:gentisate 1,2-dioxygenase [Immundisolibacterales bacterium]